MKCACECFNINIVVMLRLTSTSMWRKRLLFSFSSLIFHPFTIGIPPISRLKRWKQVMLMACVHSMRNKRTFPSIIMCGTTWYGNVHFLLENFQIIFAQQTAGTKSLAIFSKHSKITYLCKAMTPRRSPQIKYIRFE